MRKLKSVFGWFDSNIKSGSSRIEVYCVYSHALGDNMNLVIFIVATKYSRWSRCYGDIGLRQEI